MLQHFPSEHTYSSVWHIYSYELIIAAQFFFLVLVLKDITLVPTNMAALHVWKKDVHKRVRYLHE